MAAGSPRIPLVAIVGRPNVGKSRLFNRLTGSRRAIVENTPGVTRDRNYGEAEWDGRVFNLVDTGGFDPESTEELPSKMREQAELAIQEADVVLVLLDGRAGLARADWEIAELLRRTEKRVIWGVNKIDGPGQDALVMEFHELGVAPLFGISAEHGRGVDELAEALTEGFPVREEGEAEDDAERPTYVAVMGRPNVGKSTLVNQILGEQRLLTSEIPGTTRDAIDTLVERAGQRYVLIDTAGIRRKRSISLTLEKISVIQALQSVDRADVVLFVLDAVEGPTDQDAKLLSMVDEKGRGLVLLVNKWDLVEKDHKTADAFFDGVRSALPFCRYAPIELISAKTGQRVHKLLPLALQVRESWRRRIPTAELNQFLAGAVARTQPPVYRNRRVKLYYMTQIRTGPPTFAIVCNRPDGVPEHYARYLLNQLREAYGFEGTPLRLRFRRRTGHGP